MSRIYYSIHRDLNEYYGNEIDEELKIDTSLPREEQYQLKRDYDLKRGVPTVRALLIPKINSNSYRFSVKQLVDECDSLFTLKNQKDLNKFFGVQQN